MTWQQTIDDEKFFAREEGRAEGLTEGARKNARNFLRETDLPAEQIARCCSLPLEEVLALKEEIEKEAVES